MAKKVIYKERLTALWMIGTFGILALLFLSLFLYQSIRGPLGSDPAPDWFFLLMCALFCALTLNFWRMSIEIREDAVTVSYGIVRRTVLIKDIKDCYSSQATSLRYGGWGIRVWRGRGKGKWRIVYSVTGTSLVALSLQRGRLDEFMFSTKNRDRVVRIINELIASE